MTNRKTNIMMAIAVILIPSFIYSTAITTGCIIGFTLLSFTCISQEKIRALSRSPIFYLLVFVFLNTLISGINSENKEAWIHGLNIKLPFLFLPLAFYFLPRFKKSQVVSLHLWFIVVMVISAIPVLLQALIHYDDILMKIGQGQSIATPVEHVKYSMLNAYAFICGIYFAFKPSEVKNANRKLLLSASFIVFVVMHVLAVRTGLVIIYCSLPILVISLIKSNAVKVGFVVIIILMPFIAYRTIPSFKSKIGYMLYDYRQYNTGNGGTYSDSERWMSNSIGIDLLKDNLIMGTGWGDLQEECSKIYQAKWPNLIVQKLPHSQFLTVVARSGIIGLLIFCIGLLGPFVLFKGKYKLLYGLLLINFILSFLVENSLERSFMVAFFLFFSLILIGTSHSKLADNTIL